MKKFKITLIAIAFMVGCGIPAMAQGEFTVGAEVVSSYVWRGAKSGNASFQPSLGYSIANFSIGAWGSTGFNDGTKEVDFSASYDFGPVYIMVTDYWWSGESGFNYFDYKDAHFFEATVGGSFKNFSLSANVMFLGKSDVNTDGDQAYSTYIEAGYEFTLKDIDFGVTLGFTPMDGMYSDGINVVNIALKGTKDIKITDNFSIPIFTSVILNPYQEDIHFVAGFSF